MKSFGRLVAVVLAVAVAFVAAVALLRPSEESRVKAAFARVEEALSKSEGESMIMSAVRTRSIADLADDKVGVAFPAAKVDEVFSREDAARVATTVRASCLSLSVKFRNVCVESIEGDAAAASAEAVVTATGATLPGVGSGALGVSARLRKNPDDGRWRFSHVKVEEAGGR